MIGYEEKFLSLTVRENRTMHGVGELAQWWKGLAALAEPGFNYQHPHGNSQLPVAPVPGEPMPSSSVCRHCTHEHTHVLHRHAGRQNKLLKY